MACPPTAPRIDTTLPDSGGIQDAGPTPLTASAYCEEIVGFFCNFYLRCGRMAVEDTAACEAQFLETCNARFEPTYVALADAGLLALSREGVDSCRAHLDDVECAMQVRDLDGPCAGMWVGTQPAGSACGFDVETFVCAPGTACVLGLDLCGTCEATVPDGATCVVEPDAAEVTCGRESTCSAAGVCTPRKRVGEACTDADRCVLGASCGAESGRCESPLTVGLGATCNLDNRCPYGSVCMGGTCQRTAALGETCNATTLCHSGFCDAPSGDTGTCMAFVAQGAPCNASSQCQTGACTDGRCRTVPSACFP